MKVRESELGGAAPKVSSQARRRVARSKPSRTAFRPILASFGITGRSLSYAATSSPMGGSASGAFFCPSIRDLLSCGSHLKTSFMKTTKAFCLQAVRQSHGARVYGRDRVSSLHIPQDHPSARCAPVNGLAGCYVSTIGKPHEYFDLTRSRGIGGRRKDLPLLQEHQSSF